MDYLDYVMQRALGRRGRSHPTVRHQSACGCGRRLVNLYFRDGQGWKCRKCWEMEDRKAFVDDGGEE